MKFFPNDKQIILFLDKRVKYFIDIPSFAKVIWIKPKIFSRMIGEVKLFLYSKKDSVIVNFNSLPPLFPCKGKVIVFQQNILLLKKEILKNFSMRMKFKIKLNRLFSFLLINNVNKFLVQTNTMKKEINNCYGKKREVKIIPFTENAQNIPSSKIKKGIVYIADGIEHKNHHNLLKAWSLLGRNNIKPKLILTLSSNNKSLLSKIEYLRLVEGLDIENLNIITHEKTLEIYENAEALIFPSLAESFGLPLLEASKAGLPIIAPELDFVRDVCDPVQTFDPSSPTSIMRAVSRFLEKPIKKVEIKNASHFLEEIFNYEN
jgi:glycosyltransferase involved in cell wall biosynthesis